MVKKNNEKKIEKGDIVTRFWYTLKNLHPKCSLAMLVLFCVKLCKLTTMNLVEGKKKFLM
jgi:hypothetical protein